jgi:hypothetical protein
MNIQAPILDGVLTTTIAPAHPEWIDGGSPTMDPHPTAGVNYWQTIDGTQVVWSHWINPDFPRIRLKLSEVERLREAAREDEALKAVLQKFTGHIEIEVDFA